MDFKHAYGLDCTVVMFLAEFLMSLLDRWWNCPWVEEVNVGAKVRSYFF